MSGLAEVREIGAWDVYVVHTIFFDVMVVSGGNTYSKENAQYWWLALLSTIGIALLSCDGLHKCGEAQFEICYWSDCELLDFPFGIYLENNIL